MERLYFLLIAVLIAAPSIAQTKKINSFTDLPPSSYSTQDLKINDSVSVNNWIQHAAAMELKHDDSVIQNYIITNPEIKKQLFKNNVYCYFISENWNSTISAIENYKGVYNAPSYWTKSNFIQILSYAKSKEQGASALNKNYFSVFNDSLNELKQDDKDRLTENVLAGLDDSYDDLDAGLKEIKEQNNVTSNDLTLLMQAYVFTRIAKDVLTPLQQVVNDRENEKYTIDAHLRIPIRNGLRLGGILVLPKYTAKPLPAVLIVNCYAKDKKLRDAIAQTKKIADNGFAGLMIFSRGKAESEGEFDAGETASQDNYDIIDWISKQPWCNEKIGMVGGSYAGQMQWQATVKLHPALKTIIPQVAAYNGTDVPFLNGVYQTSGLPWLEYVSSGHYDNVHGRNDEDWNKIYSTYLIKGIAFNKLDSLALGKTSDLFQRWLLHSSYDDYWGKMSPDKQQYAKINIPVLSMTGYFDDEQRGAIAYYNMHQKYGPKGTAKNHYLFIGPFDHNGAQGYPSNFIYPYQIDSAALINENKMVYQWFNYILKDSATPEFLKDRVAVFVLGENKWHFFPDVKTMNSDTAAYFLSNDIDSTSNNLQLTSTKNIKPGALSIKFNTADVSYDTLEVYTGEGSLVTEEIFKKKNKIVFESMPFKSNVILNGTITADLYLSLSAPDADIMLSWWEKDAEGKLWPLSQTVQRLSYCFDKSRRILWEKDKIYHVTLNNAYWMAKQMKKGSRLIMTVSPLADKGWEKNYGSGKNVSTETIQDGRPVELKIYTGKKYPANIKVPIM